MTAARTPYQDTSVSVSKSQETVRAALRAAGARAVQFEEEWIRDAADENEAEAAVIRVRFVWAIGDAFDQTVRVRLEVRPLPPESGARGAWRVSPEQRERQAWRALAWYLKTMLEAAAFGLLKFEDVFLSFVEGEDGRTVGERVIPMLERGRLALTDGGGAS